MAKFHINDKGEAKKCSAKPGNCPITKETGEEHYNTKEEAQEAYEKFQSKILFNSLRNNNDGIKSAEQSYIYAQWSLLNNHLHDSIGRGNNAELFYYSSPAGRLELDRRIKSNVNKDSYKEILRKIEDKEFDPINVSEDDKEFFELLADEGKDLLSEQFQSNALNVKNFKRVDARIGSFLINHSQKWLKNLTVDEQEVLSHSTSNGFYLVNDSMEKESNVKDPHFNVDSTGMSEEEYDEYAQDFTNKLRSAVIKAPKLEEPIKTYRGIKLQEFNQMFEHTDSKSNKELVSKILNGDFTGQKLPKVDKFGNTTKLSHAPVSATANPQRSINYSESNYEDRDNSFAPVLEIEARTMASPISVSAWGSGEAEVYTNHTSDYEIIGARMDSSKSKKIFVVQLREIVKG